MGPTASPTSFHSGQSQERKNFLRKQGKWRVSRFTHAHWPVRKSIMTHVKHSLQAHFLTTRSWPTYFRAYSITPIRYFRCPSHQGNIFYIEYIIPYRQLLVLWWLRKPVPNLSSSTGLRFYRWYHVFRIDQNRRLIERPFLTQSPYTELFKDQFLPDDYIFNGINICCTVSISDMN